MARSIGLRKVNRYSEEFKATAMLSLSRGGIGMGSATGHRGAPASLKRWTACPSPSSGEYPVGRAGPGGGSP